MNIRFHHVRSHKNLEKATLIQTLYSVLFLSFLQIFLTGNVIPARIDKDILVLLFFRLPLHKEVRFTKKLIWYILILEGIMSCSILMNIWSLL